MEGVALCGGGKWADIKKLCFSAIETRSAVDLKVRVQSFVFLLCCLSPHMAHNMKVLVGELESFTAASICRTTHLTLAAFRVETGIFCCPLFTPHANLQDSCFCLSTSGSLSSKYIMVHFPDFQVTNATSCYLPSHCILSPPCAQEAFFRVAD